MNKTLGLHYIIELRGCELEILVSKPRVEKVLIEAVEVASATYVTHDFHQFKPVGVSGVVIIAESHFTIHTWPEEAYAAVDIFSCGEMEAQQAIDFLKKEFSADSVEVQVLTRNA